MIVNIEKIARENPELIKTVIGNKDPNVVLQDAYMVMGARVTYNYEMYSETNDSSKFLDPTLVVYSANQKDNYCIPAISLANHRLYSELHSCI